MKTLKMVHIKKKKKNLGMQEKRRDQLQSDHSYMTL